ncbi:SDR family NAD(P)-dependent oxidoreductase [Streptomyces arenae]|uniref:SDR family NAD(P)-dependent oxidoreductase n=1 Tax=Streptomyces arenae TaxID=29301 RepID=UPI002657CD52|nr:SDR family oxidoreductase [Streptomyces arenae]MCG7210854.1 SDR family oxidoreductase [Streptomyces arenae]
MNGRTVVVTGGASGIGRGLATRFAAEGARVVVSDLAARTPAVTAGLRYVQADVSKEADIERLVVDVLDHEGPIDLFCSNAGIGHEMDPMTPQGVWDKVFAVNVMSHVWAARHVLPHMLERGEGYLLNTASASGLLTELTSPGYAASKHAAVGFAEWLAFTYADRGIRTSVLCPEAVRTPILDAAPYLLSNAITVEAVAETVIQALRDEQFMIYTHPTTPVRFQQKAADYEAYIAELRVRRSEATRGAR